MEAPIGGIGVFGRAGFAQRKFRQRRGGAVVGQAPGHGEARTAMRAGDEGIEVTAVGRIEHLGKARFADRHVGRDRGPRRAVLLAVADDEFAFVRNERHAARIRRSSIRASGGASATRSPTKVSTSPCTSISTPSWSFKAKPVRSSRIASRQTCGRKPTPCTSPRTRSRRRRVATPAAPWPMSKCTRSSMRKSPASPWRGGAPARSRASASSAPCLRRSWPKASARRWSD